MSLVRLAALGLAAIVVCGRAQAQTPSPDFQPLAPPYEEMLGAVAEAGCERSETSSFIRFFCEEGRAVWYFSQAGRLKHPDYRVLPAYRARGPADIAATNRALQQIKGVTWFDSAEELDAFMVWMREVIADSSEIARSAGPVPRFKR